MSRIRLIFASALLGCLGLALHSGAISEAKEPKKKKTPNIEESPKGVKDSAKTKAIDDLALAARLIQYGRAEKHAESLLIAAQILHKTPTEKLDVGSKVKGEAPANATTPKAADDSPKALVAEAKKLSTSPAVASLAKETMKILDEAPRGASGGPRTDNFTIQPGQSITWNPITFIGLQPASVFINNGVFGNMLLEVFDQFGNRVRVDGVPGTFFSASWTPAFNGPFTIRLTNRDNIAFNCRLATN